MVNKIDGNGILVVGDWVVDEYWFLNRHQSELSSHTGYLHYRIATNDKDTIYDLCGAGHVARVLYSIRENKSIYKLYGIGKWNSNDDILIKHLIHSREESSCNAADGSVKITKKYSDRAPTIGITTLDPNSPTIRVIRQYKQEGKNLEQINRVDWEPPNVPNKGINLQDYKKLPDANEITSIVIQDLKKGVIDDDLISRLFQKYPNALWYVRSKEFNPSWISIIKEKLELILFGPEIAALENPWDSWLVNGKISHQALEILDNSLSKNTVLLTDKREMIFVSEKTPKCIASISKKKITELSQLGWPSAIFSALIYSLITENIPNTDDDIKEYFSKILVLADKHGGIKIPESIKFTEDESDPPLVIIEDLKEQRAIKKQAISGTGIIKSGKGELRMDVWRGSSNLESYVTCIKEKQKIINRIGKYLRGFEKNQSPKRSLSIMLQADPGAGKTFLARSLAKEFNFAFLQCDVTQLINRESLYDVFDKASSMQAASKEKLLIFVDEINASLQNGRVFGSFLTPLEDGYYTRKGNNFALKPCVWIFAGTNIDNDVLDSGEKLSDFKSRVTRIEKLDYLSLEKKYIKRGGWIC